MDATELYNKIKELTENGRIIVLGNLTITIVGCGNTGEGITIQNNYRGHNVAGASAVTPVRPTWPKESK